ncbi:NfeD family protein, partial [Geminisphaera colitermitum]|uniref:NfeD family protein n=1 Tax=Geminisphaera colitermitum TaxID=1148786 RepID=UPI0005B8089E
MNAILLLFLIGVLLLAFEVVVPGAILGTLGALSLIVGCALAFVYHGATGGGIAVAVALLLVGILLVIEFAILPRTRWGRRFFLHKSIDSQSQPPVAAEGIAGSIGTADTTLAPTGYVFVDGRRYEAVSRSGLIEKGATITVIGTSTF